MDTQGAVRWIIRNAGGERVQGSQGNEVIYENRNCSPILLGILLL
jgi:hypothetical protein